MKSLEKRCVDVKSEKEFISCITITAHHMKDQWGITPMYDAQQPRIKLREGAEGRC